MKTNDGFVIRRRTKYYVVVDHAVPEIGEATCTAIIGGVPYFNRSRFVTYVSSLGDLNASGYFIFAKRKNAVRKIRLLLRRRISNIEFQLDGLEVCFEKWKREQE